MQMATIRPLGLQILELRAQPRLKSRSLRICLISRYVVLNPLVGISRRHLSRRRSRRRCRHPFDIGIAAPSIASRF
jgi:hypothetical protein